MTVCTILHNQVQPETDIITLSAVIHVRAVNYSARSSMLNQDKMYNHKTVSARAGTACLSGEPLFVVEYL